MHVKPPKRKKVFHYITFAALCAPLLCLCVVSQVCLSLSVSAVLFFDLPAQR